MANIAPDIEFEAMQTMVWNVHGKPPPSHTKTLSDNPENELFPKTKMSRMARSCGRPGHASRLSVIQRGLE